MRTSGWGRNYKQLFSRGMVHKGDVLRAPPTELAALSSAIPQVVKVPTAYGSYHQYQAKIHLAFFKR